MPDFIETLKERNAPLYVFGWILLAMAGICVVMWMFTDRKVLGINSWVKPFKFFLSSAIFSWTMAWIMFYLNEPKKVGIFSWVVIAVLGFETIYIAVQAARGELSHFNSSSSFYSFMFFLMGMSITIMTLWTGYIGYLFFVNDFAELKPSYLWGIRMGILLFVIFAFEGALMATRLSHTVGAPDGGSGLPLTNWSTEHGDLRVSHFLGMHALQLLPLCGYFIFKTPVSIIIISIIYFLAALFLFVQALAGRPLFRL